MLYSKIDKCWRPEYLAKHAVAELMIKVRAPCLYLLRAFPIYDNRFRTHVLIYTDMGSHYFHQLYEGTTMSYSQ